MIPEQTKKQFIALHGEPDKQSKTAKAVYDILFKGSYRIVASKEHGVSESAISVFIRNNQFKHDERYKYCKTK